MHIISHREWKAVIHSNSVNFDKTFYAFWHSKSKIQKDFLKWIVNECQPLDASKSADFQQMILGLDSRQLCPLKEQ
jgi:hypothetical protein